jgi:hypothetical protein
MATRKRARDEEGQYLGDDPATPENEAWITAPELSQFLGAELPGTSEQIATALQLSTTAAERFLGRPLPDLLPHNLAQGVRLLASSLLLSNRLEEPPTDADIPLVVRYYWKAGG